MPAHPRGDALCGECRAGYPLPCACGGLLHAPQGCVIETACDRPGCTDPTPVPTRMVRAEAAEGGAVLAEAVMREPSSEDLRRCRFRWPPAPSAADEMYERLRVRATGEPPEEQARERRQYRLAVLCVLIDTVSKETLE